ncbi:hypothetical protein BDZ97DRAFT_488363 [Flammula alnicola]|nr:hypothetical protein BDZ97DRAFT_488363 [Flammula alnicola]
MPSNYSNSHTSINEQLPCPQFPPRTPQQIKVAGYGPGPLSRPSSPSPLRKSRPTSRPVTPSKSTRRSNSLSRVTPSVSLSQARRQAHPYSRPSTPLPGSDSRHRDDDDLFPVSPSKDTPTSQRKNLGFGRPYLLTSTSKGTERHPSPVPSYRSPSGQYTRISAKSGISSRHVTPDKHIQKVKKEFEVEPDIHHRRPEHTIVHPNPSRRVGGEYRKV